MEDSQPLHTCHLHKSSIIIHRSHTFVHVLAVGFLVYYRASFFFRNDIKNKGIPTLPWLLLFVSELLLFFIWLLGQAFRWRPVSRTVFPERLPEDDKLPSIDVLIFTADPDREPTLQVMNTVLSAMAMDYPPDKLNVYLSDDGGGLVTLKGIKEAWNFAKWWIPFCRRFGIQKRCPEAYFSAPANDDDDDDHGDFGSSDEFVLEREKLKEKYQAFKKSVKSLKGTFEDNSGFSGKDHPSVIEVIQGNPNELTEQEDQSILPRLVYVSREKRSSHPHHFKAGALNTLLRVSGVMSNSPYILALDCDMYCNDPTSARQAMCFHLDPNISSSLAFVQFPQRFHNIARKDIYESALRYTFSTLWQGLDGLDGPVLSGTGFVIKRMSLYGSFVHEGADPMELKKYFGPSNEFIKSLFQHIKSNIINGKDSSNELLQEAKFLASCTYGNQTKWGEEVGFLYYSVVEDCLTGFTLQSKGWNSVYLSSSKPQFLGSGVTNLNDLLIQGTRWSTGLVEIGISKFCPFIYGPSKMSFLEKMCYGYLSFLPLYCLPVWCLATIPQLYLLNGISLYPEVSNSFFIIFMLIFISSLAQQSYEILITGGPFRSLIYEQRIWMIKSITSHLYGTLDAFMERIGMREASFVPTNKVEDDERVKLYEKGAYDFRTSKMFLSPLVALVTLNTLSLLVGIARAILVGDLNKMFVQVFISFYILAINYPIIEGMVIRKDKGRIPTSVTILSAILSTIIFLFVGSRFLI
ncbi:Cellulose synthase-like protein G2 [Morus notabilis]|uniref:Cellulose synthase-like protein G2 n=1 Tax=Morus notabilis TaxID=981085 RepID=W9R3T7_9ROSA|nr:cellulose synthase-like protein G2 [Morus notabilis]EXB55545.1 Cellulose synthase-like protein G2 [Morus notabilis]